MAMQDGIKHYNGFVEATDLIGVSMPLSMDLAGAVTVNHRGDRYLAAMLNLPGAFEGDITNRQNIGKTADELVQLWNEEHPEDLVVD